MIRHLEGPSRDAELTGMGCAKEIPLRERARAHFLNFLSFNISSIFSFTTSTWCSSTNRVWQLQNGKLFSTSLPATSSSMMRTTINEQSNSYTTMGITYSTENSELSTSSNCYEPFVVHDSWLISINRLFTSSLLRTATTLYIQSIQKVRTKDFFLRGASGVMNK